MPDERGATTNFREDIAQGALTVLAGLLSDPDRRRRISANIQIGVGIFLLVFGYWLGHDHCRLVFSGVKTQGKLVGYEEQRFNRSSGGNSFSSTASMPIVELQAQGQTIRFRDWVGSNFRTPMGAAVQVLYDPQHPKNAMIDRPVMNWIPWAPMMAVGIFLTISGVRLRIQ
ncbi:MAG TPA: DUF3592 domain-containing protein [Candidatus Sulfotelmatobacter sp.]|nr:DUF3592 domain-containing protein [Candidatus Sulfotelmatobacter sp.]